MRLKAAGFTNFTQDHLDYHGTMEAYFAAKARPVRPRFCPRTAWRSSTWTIREGPDMAELARGARACACCASARGRGRDLRILGQRFDATGQDVRFAVAGRGRTRCGWT